MTVVWEYFVDAWSATVGHIPTAIWDVAKVGSDTASAVSRVAAPFLEAHGINATAFADFFDNSSSGFEALKNVGESLEPEVAEREFEEAFHEGLEGQFADSPKTLEEWVGGIDRNCHRPSLTPRPSRHRRFRPYGGGEPRKAGAVPRQ